MQRFRQEQQQDDGSELIYWVWLKQIPGIGPMMAKELLKTFHHPKDVYEADIEELITVEGIGLKRAEQMIHMRSLARAEEEISECQKNNIKIMTLAEKCYPDYAKAQLDMPIYLYYKGKIRQESIGSAVVGPRRCSSDAKEKAVSRAIALSEDGIPVISGMAKGIDAYAHTACLKKGGYTVAVLGNGLDICYPSEHKLLMRRIAENGLLLSEYGPGTMPSRQKFPLRNRIIAAWSREIYVIGSGSRSGARITAEYGKQYGRKVVFE